MLATIIVILTHWLLMDVYHRHITSTTDSNHGVSETGEQAQLLSLKEIERRLATACNCLLSCVAAWRSKLRYLRMLYHAGVYPPFGFLSSTKESQKNLILRTVRAHCTNYELSAGNRCLVCTLVYVGILLLSSLLYLSVSLPPSPACHAGSWWWSQMRARTSIIASFVLAAGG